MSCLADVAMVILVAGMLALLCLGIGASARRGGRDTSSATKLGAFVAFTVVVWLALTALVASSGVLLEWDARPPRWPFVPLSAFVAVIALSQTSAVNVLLASAPRSWPIAAQSFRVGVELVLFALHESGRAPVQVTFEGRNFDILVGLTAPGVAWLVAKQRATPALVIAWNVLGLALLANAVVTIATSVPGPLHHDWPGGSFTAAATWPVIWLPAFLAPLAVFFHVASLRQTRR